jgi:phosphatidate cytidylyltransferase
VLSARLASAAILAPLVVGGVLFLPTAGVALALALVLGAGLWEWGAMIPLSSAAARVIYALAVLLLMGIAWVAPLDRVLVPMLLLAGLWWLAALFWLVHPAFGVRSSSAVRVLKGLAGVLVSLPCWTAFVALHGRGSQGPDLCLALLVTIWLADSGAYFAGRRWGRTRLAPVISPGKTREGVLGGIVASVAAVLVAGYWYSGSWPWTFTLAAVALLAVMFSVVGDLLESLMKRQAGIKDSGSLIPGHGGVLDRIDSLTAAAPVFLMGLLWFGL